MKFLLCLLLALPFTASAADTNPPPRLTVEMRDGSRIVGSSVEPQLKFRSALFGDLKLAVQDIHSIEWTAINSVKLKAANGDVLGLQLTDAHLALKTGFGKVELAFDSIRQLSVAAAAANIPRREGLVGFWAGNGNADDSVGSNHGSLMGAATFAAGPSGQVFNFDAPGSFVKIPKASALDPGSQVSLEFWMKADPANAMNHYQGLVTSEFYYVEISNGYGGTMGVNFALSLVANQPSRRSGLGAPGFHGGPTGITSVGNYTHVSDVNGGGAVVSAGQWHHIAGTYDGAQLQLYIDGAPWGKPVFCLGTIAPMLPNSFVAIGSEDGRTTCPDCIASRYFKGQISNVAIYNRPLSRQEILEDYEAGRPN